MYGVVKLAALSAALAAALVTMTDGRRSGSGANPVGGGTIDTAPTSRNAPLATDRCAEAAWPVAEEGCSVTEANASIDPVRLAALDRPEASASRTIAR